MNIEPSSYHPPTLALCRRRDAARRLPALECGCRDPHTCPDAAPPRPAIDRGPTGVDLDHMRDASLALVARVGHPGKWDMRDVRALYDRDNPGDQLAALRIRKHMTTLTHRTGLAA
ncbi:hypothetical protein [Rhodococcus koreensis]|uniref:hypothetical protein n=1 Tax=Rhodococcus koreensis TaxID=99653 RepID=UPI00366F8126